MTTLSRGFWLAAGVVLMGLAGCGSAPSTGVAVHDRPVAEWLKDLRSPDVKARRQAARVLGRVGAVDDAIVPALTEALKDRDGGVRLEAVTALEKAGRPAAPSVPLLQALARSDADPRVRSRAAEAAAVLSRN
jgi:HEAT repeat protein